MNSLPSKEIFRKSIHLFSSTIPLGYYFIITDRLLMIKILLLFSIVFIFIDLARNKVLKIKYFFDNWFSIMLRDHESRGEITGATWLVISSLITIIIFPREIAVPAILFLTIGDAFAAIVGKIFPLGNIKGKTISGSISGLFMSLLVIIPIMDNINYKILILGGFSAMAIELLSIPIDDNFTIPIISGFTMFLGLQLI